MNKALEVLRKLEWCAHLDGIPILHFEPPPRVSACPICHNVNPNPDGFPAGILADCFPEHRIGHDSLCTLARALREGDDDD